MILLHSWEKKEQNNFREKEKASIGMLQREFKIGFNRAVRLMDQMEKIGFVGPEEGVKPRMILGNSIESYLAKIEKGEE